MKIVCTKQDLLNGLQIVSKAVPNKTTMSILECILIDATNNHISLTANDMELGIETIIEGNIINAGMIAIDARFFLEIVRRLPDNDVTIETDSNYNTTIICEKSKFDILAKSGEDFASLPKIERKENIIINQFSLKEVIHQTIFSTIDNENKMMSGELFQIEGNNLKVVSLDGHRVSIRNIKLRDDYVNRKLIVPGKTLNELSKILSGDTESDIVIYFTDNHILFEFDDTTIVSRLIEGDYFKIDKMINADYETKININKRELQACIDRATLLTKEGDKKPIIMNIKDDIMELKIKSTFGSMNEDIYINKNGKDLMIGFNPKFMMDALKVIDEEYVDLYMLNSKSPCIIKDNSESYIYLILPVNFIAI